jgi:transposase-like protein
MVEITITMAVDIGIFFSNHGAELGKRGKRKVGGRRNKKENWEKKLKRRSGFGVKRSTAPTLTLRSIFLSSLPPQTLPTSS